jgi:hypothetical protein
VVHFLVFTPDSDLSLLFETTSQRPIFRADCIFHPPR